MVPIRASARAALALMVAVALIATVAPAANAEDDPTFQARPAGYAVVSTGAAITASAGTEFNAGEGPAQALTDGDPTTKTGGVGQLDFVVDLGRVIPFGHVQIDFDRLWDGPNSIQISDDGATWAGLLTSSGTDYMLNPAADTLSANSLGYLTPEGTEARYLRISTGDWANIFEVSLSGEFDFVGVPANMQNLAINAPVTALNGTEFNLGEGVGSNITDGDHATKSGGVGLIDFMVDLGSTVSIDYINIDFHRLWDGPNRIYTSDDGVSWQLALVTSGTQYMNELDNNELDPNVLGASVPGGIHARYVRYTGRDWANIYEFAVYSSATIPTESITLTGPDNNTLIVGVPTMLSASIVPATASTALTWSVADAGGSATIDSVTGILTPTAVGDVVITAETTDGTALTTSMTLEVVDSGQTWRAFELALSSSVDYADPFMDVDVTATFTGPGGVQLVRQAFWDGGDTWRIRFAPTVAGTWAVSVSSTDSANSGLSANGLSFMVDEYDGPLAVYEHGFPRVADDGKYFTYDDGTPFLYVGETHWLMLEEPWDGSNVEGVPSQFKYAVDQRVSQGFTVYQSQPLTLDTPGINVSDGVGVSALASLRDLDRKFAYIADAGLAHANSSWVFADQLGVTDPTTLRKLGEYWQARYGANPVFWTTAQEIDPTFYGADPQYWKALAGALSDADAYNHPLTAHMQAQSGALNTGWGTETFHDWYGMQTQSADRALYEDAYANSGDKPVITYEGPYELNTTTDGDARRIGYRAFLNGSYGYGYGVQGVWATNYSPDDWFPYGPYYRWFDGLQAPGGKQMEHLSAFMRSVQWWSLQPAFGDTSVATFLSDETISMATDGNRTYVGYFEPNHTSSPGSLLGMSGGPYDAWWFDPRTGDYQLIDDGIVPVAGEWVVPIPPNSKDWVLLVTQDASESLTVSAAGDTTTIAEAGGSLQFSAHVRDEVATGVVWSVAATDGGSTDAATISSSGLLTAHENGSVMVCATTTEYQECRALVLLRQETTTPLAVAQTITLDNVSGRQILAHFTPSDTFNQKLTWVVTEPDGSPTTKASISVAGVLALYIEGTVLITATAQDGSGVQGQLLYDIVFNDVITNPLLAGATATASSSDYRNDYRPQKALTSTHGDWAGWTSQTDAGVSFENPAWLQVDLPEARTINTMDLYSTANNYQLRSYDLQIWVTDDWVTVGQVRDATDTHTSLTFAAVTTEKFRVVCYDGDALGIARISAIEPGFDPTLPTPPAATAAPAVTGSGSVGQTLTVSSGTWNPAEAAVTLQWLRNGETIPGATGSQYKLTVADEGATLQVAVTASANALSSTVVTEGIVVRFATSVKIALSSVVATNRLPARVTVSVKSAGALEGQVITVQAGNKTVTGVLDASGRATVTLPKLPFGLISVRATLAAGDEFEGSISKPALYLSVPI